MIANKLVPIAGMVLSAGASAVYGYQGDWRRCLYWFLCACIPIPVTF